MKRKKRNNLGPLIDYLFRFMQKMRLIPSSRHAFVAVSGGVDSMFLLFCLNQLKIRGDLATLEVIHINHGTRKENHEEEMLVVEFCKSLDLPSHVHHLQMKLSSNFEKDARNRRYEIFDSYLKDGDFLYTAHHIDDSFEWSLLQKWKSSSLKSALGIPVVRGPYARPLMCMTKKQILFWAREMNIPFRHDPSNKENHHDRNFVRNRVIPRIQKRFPGYLKHYVYRSNFLAQKLGVSRQTVTVTDSLLFEDLAGGLGIFHKDFSHDFSSEKELIFDLVKKLSHSERGTLHLQIDKLIAAAKEGKQGPLLFSGGVLGFIRQGCLYFIHRDNLSLFSSVDEWLAKRLLEVKNSEIPSLDYESLSQKFLLTLKNKEVLFPFLIFGLKEDFEKILPSIKKKDPLFPISSQLALDLGLWAQILPRFLFRLSRVKHKEKSYSLYVPNCLKSGDKL